MESRCDVRRGDFGCLISCSSSPFVCGSVTSETAEESGESGSISCTVLLTEEDRCLVRDRVVSTGVSLTVSTVVAGEPMASSNVSYQGTYHQQKLYGIQMLVKGSCDRC